jgi:hypothetical protein
MRIENVKELLKENKVESVVQVAHNFTEGDVVCITNGIEQTKSGVTKRILVGRLAVVIGDSKKSGKLQVVLLDSKGNLQGSLVRVPVDEVTLYEEPEAESNEAESKEAEAEAESNEAEAEAESNEVEEGSEEA